MNIISASRRTDIPAFYAEWFMNRIRAGGVQWRNPFGGKMCEVSLRPDDVSAIVFWSRNYAPLIPHLPELDALGYWMVFQFTINGLPDALEPHVPPVELAVYSAKTLAERYTPEHVLWRYDPVVISSITDAEYHYARFRQIASAMEGFTNRCYFSFPCFYGKVLRNASKLKEQTGVELIDPPLDQRLEIAMRLAVIAAEYGISMFSCCGDYLVNERILKAHCVDAPLLHRLFPEKLGPVKERPTRKECGCFESKDIGAYDTCPHGCVYCYANASREVALARYTKRDPEREMLDFGSSS